MENEFLKKIQQNLISMLTNKMNLAKQGGYDYANQALGRINPFSTLYTRNAARSGFPWVDNLVNDQTLAVARFGRKRKSSKKKIGWTKKGKRYVKVYKFKGLKGKRYSNKRKIGKGKRVYKKKPKSMRKKRRTTKKRLTNKKIMNKIYDKMFFGNKTINPSVGANYSYDQWQTNVGTPTAKQMERSAGTPVYSFPSSRMNFRSYNSTNNTTGMGF